MADGKSRKKFLTLDLPLLAAIRHRHLPDFDFSLRHRSDPIIFKSWSSKRFSLVRGQNEGGEQLVALGAGDEVVIPDDAEVALLRPCTPTL